MLKRARSHKALIAIAALAVALAGGITSANALVILSDNFNADPAGPNTLQGVGDGTFHASSGYVDTVGATPTPFFASLAYVGNSIDLNGSGGAQGTLSSNTTLNAGQTYTLTFDLAGTMRGAAVSTTTVSVGSQVLAVLSPASSTGYTPETYTFTATSGGALSFASSASTNPNIGNLLDNVEVTSTASGVPEPSTWAMMVLGFAGLGFAGYRRSAKRLPVPSSL